MRENIFLTEEEWQQRIDEARREIAAAQVRLEDSKRKLAAAVAAREACRKLAQVVAEREARDEREKA